jgi:hypothetical protein
VDAVVLKGVGELIGARQIVYRHHIKVISKLGDAKDSSANTAETVDGNFRLSHSDTS